MRTALKGGLGSSLRHRKDVPIVGVAPKVSSKWVWPKKRSKFGNVRTTVDGIKFASKREANRYAELKLLEKGGKIFDLKCQPRFPLMVSNQKVGVYVGDFSYRETGIFGGKLIVEDVKGVQTEAFKLKWAIVKAMPLDIDWRIVK